FPIDMSSTTDTATTELYTLSLHDALPISALSSWPKGNPRPPIFRTLPEVALLSIADARKLFADLVLSPNDSTAAMLRNEVVTRLDRKSTRLNSSHLGISYAVFCLKKKKNK